MLGMENARVEDEDENGNEKRVISQAIVNRGL
jgi:hypothetical protein